MEKIVTGVNDSEENIIVETYTDKTVVRTMQTNDWVRVNIYWDNGDTEETYEH